DSTNMAITENDSKLKNESYKIKQVSTVKQQYHTPTTNKKFFLTNSDKSVYNLKWQVNEMVEKPAQHSRIHSDNNNREHNHKQHVHKHHSHHQHQSPIASEEQIPELVSELFHYPYAYPRIMVPRYTVISYPVFYEASHDMPASVPVPLSKQKPVKINDKPINLVRGFDKLNVKQYYVHSSKKFQEMLQSLEKQGYVHSTILQDEGNKNV
ncbi:unnamed protein product, partial [Didymodactylos carnosus]